MFPMYDFWGEDTNIGTIAIVTQSIFIERMNTLMPIGKQEEHPANEGDECGFSAIVVADWVFSLCSDVQWGSSHGREQRTIHLAIHLTIHLARCRWLGVDPAKKWATFEDVVVRYRSHDGKPVCPGKGSAGSPGMGEHLEQDLSRTALSSQNILSAMCVTLNFPSTTLKQSKETEKNKQVKLISKESFLTSNEYYRLLRFYIFALSLCAKCVFYVCNTSRFRLASFHVFVAYHIG